MIEELGLLISLHVMYFYNIVDEEIVVKYLGFRSSDIKFHPANKVYTIYQTICAMITFSEDYDKSLRMDLSYVYIGLDGVMKSLQ